LNILIQNVESFGQKIGQNVDKNLDKNLVKKFGQNNCSDFYSALTLRFLPEEVAR